MRAALPDSDTGGSKDRVGDGEEGSEPFFGASAMHVETDSSAAAPDLAAVVVEKQGKE